ncbi:hypothetical protein, partial [Clostridium sp.]|uniref:hypothetical protein n=1 Tax=Clostridium sp. TaxID=1506 RepID=UPI00263456A4
KGSKPTKKQKELCKISIDYFLQAMKLAKEIHYLAQQAMDNQALSDINTVLGNYKAAYNYLLLFYTLQDSINNNELKKQIINLEATRENELKQKEIVILTQKNKIQQTQIFQTLFICFSIYFDSI